MLLIVAFPLVFALWVSTHEYDLTEGGIGAFTGWENYARTLKDEVFAVAARNTVVLSASVVSRALTRQIATFVEAARRLRAKYA